MPTLRIKHPVSGDATHELIGDRITIGRRPDNTIQIVDSSVSAHHAEFIAVDGHYRLRDLQSTNLSFVDGVPVVDFHLHASCMIGFGTVVCEYDPNGEASQPRLSHAEMEKDIAFLRGENSELLGKLNALQRRIDILSSARLVTGRTETSPSAAASDSLRAVATERDDLRHQNTGLKLELEKLREELTLTLRERDAARQANELFQAEKVTLGRELQELRGKNPKTTTERIDISKTTPPPMPGATFNPTAPAANPPNGAASDATQKLVLPKPPSRG